MRKLRRFFRWVRCVWQFRCPIHDVPLVDWRGSSECPICLEEFNHNLHRRLSRSAADED